MKSDNDFFIDGKPYKFEGSPQKVSHLLRLAGTSSDVAVLISKDGVQHNDPDELVEVSPGDHFSTRKRESTDKPAEKPIHYKVNGEDLTTFVNPLSLEAILQAAGVEAAIDLADLGSYYIENIDNGQKYEHLDDLIVVKEGDNFLAIHAGSTPVA